MMGFPSENEVNLIKSTYPNGCRVKLDSDMDDPYSPIYSGTEGTVNFVDDAGHIHVRWDNGRSLSLIPDVDYFSKIG